MTIAKNPRFLVRRLSLLAMLSALGYVLTAFAPIPYPGGAGYFNFGDAITVLSAMLLGPLEGMVTGIIAGSFADLTAGYAAFIPFTVLAKGFLGLIAGLPRLLGIRKKALAYPFPFLGGIAMALCYLIAYLAMYEEAAYISFAFDLLQGTIGALTGCLLFVALSKAKVPSLLGTEDPVYLHEVDDHEGQDEHQDVA